MRAEKLKGLTGLPSACPDCANDAAQRFYDVLAQSSGLPHGGLHILASRCKSWREFRAEVDIMAQREGKTIDWDAPLPVAKTYLAPEADPPPVTADIPAIIAAPKESN
jgi:hypothetical protein